MSLVVDREHSVLDRDLHVHPLALRPQPHVVAIGVLELLLLGRCSHTVELLAYQHTTGPSTLVSITHFSLSSSPHVNRRGLASATVPHVKTYPNARSRAFLGQTNRVRQIIADADAHPVRRSMIRRVVIPTAAACAVAHVQTETHLKISEDRPIREILNREGTISTIRRVGDVQKLIAHLRHTSHVGPFRLHIICPVG